MTSSLSFPLYLIGFYRWARTHCIYSRGNSKSNPITDTHTPTPYSMNKNEIRVVYPAPEHAHTYPYEGMWTSANETKNIVHTYSHSMSGITLCQVLHKYQWQAYTTTHYSLLPRIWNAPTHPTEWPYLYTYFMDVFVGSARSFWLLVVVAVACCFCCCCCYILLPFTTGLNASFEHTNPRCIIKLIIKMAEDTSFQQSFVFDYLDPQNI